jgi:S-adenosylmethionine:diacylglycerol 3-amino-3-carboxypropyl transferase
MYEDLEIELAVFPSSGHVFTIASAGSTSMALSARGLQVTAVDINPAQIDYVRDRLAGAPARPGTADRLFSLGRRILPLLGLRRASIRAFLELDDPPNQIKFWRRHLDTARFRAALKLGLHRRALQLVYLRTFLRVVPDHFDRVMRGRLERCFAHHSNRRNPYAWRLFLGIDPPDFEPMATVPQRIELIRADAAEYLERCPPTSFAGFTLSNILDGTDPSYRDRLMAAVRHAAAPGAIVVLRSFAEPAPGESPEWAIKDRSMLWGVVRVETLGQ